MGSLGMRDLCARGGCMASLRFAFEQTKAVSVCRISRFFQEFQLEAALRGLEGEVSPNFCSHSSA